MRYTVALGIHIGNKNGILLIIILITEMLQ